MKIVLAEYQGQTRAGIWDDETVLFTPFASVEDAISSGADLRASVTDRQSRTDVRLLTPLRPGAVLGTGSNYRDHLDERIPAADGLNAPKRELEFFVKTGLTVAPLDAPLRLDPQIGQKIDQETEIGIVIGKGCPRNVSEDRALDYVFGYILANDLTARDRQIRLLPGGGNFMVLGASKNFAGATRFADHLVTADAIPNIYDLTLETFVNGERKQNNSTRNLINSFGRIVSFFSEVLELAPGTVIITGTSGGTGWGQDTELGGKGFVPEGCTPARYLQPGDEVRSVVQNLGELTFRAA